MLPRINMVGDNADRPLTARLANGSDGSAFNAQVIPAEFVPLPTLVQPDPVGHLLGTPKPPQAADALGTITKMLLDAEASPARDGLLREWTGLSEKIAAFFAEAQQKRVAGLKQQLAELTPLCRASLDRLRQLQAERLGMDGQMHALEEPLGQANLKYRVAVAERPSDDAFPTATELAQWQDRVSKAQAAVDRVVDRVVVLREHMAIKDAEVRAEAARLADLKRRREDTKAQLEGRQRLGPHGLQIPATK